MKLGIVTDSTCDLPQYLVQERGIEVVPSILVLDGHQYADGQGLSRGEFYKRLPDLKAPATTAAPSIGEFGARYRRLFDQGCDHVLSIHAAGQLSAILGTAAQAAREFTGRVTLVDSLSLSLGLGFQVLAAAETAENGLDAAMSAVESTRRRSLLFAALDTVEYARRSGRLPGALTFLGGMLRIKPVVELADGQVRSIGAVRTTRQANERMAAVLRSGGRFERLAILHSGAEPRAREFLDRLMRESNQSLPRDILMVNVTPILGAHAGPNALGFAAVRF